MLFLISYIRRSGFVLGPVISSGLTFALPLSASLWLDGHEVFCQREARPALRLDDAPVNSRFGRANQGAVVMVTRFMAVASEQTRIETPYTETPGPWMLGGFGGALREASLKV